MSSSVKRCLGGHPCVINIGRKRYYNAVNSSYNTEGLIVFLQQYLIFEIRNGAVTRFNLDPFLLHVVKTVIIQ